MTADVMEALLVVAVGLLVWSVIGTQSRRGAARTLGSYAIELPVSPRVTSPVELPHRGDDADCRRRARTTGAAARPQTERSRRRRAAA